MKRLLLLDLESTIIPVWGNFFPLMGNCRKIKEFNDDFKATKTGTLSWALWDQSDVDIFRKEKSAVEEQIGFEIENLWTIQDYIALVKKEICGMDKQDFFDFFEKEHALFRIILNGWMKDTHIVLIDDAVTECKVTVGDTVLEIINIENM